MQREPVWWNCGVQGTLPGSSMTPKEKLILGYLDAIDGGATGAEIGLDVGAPITGQREWASSTLRNLHRKGMVYSTERLGSRATVWFIDAKGRAALKVPA